MKLGIDPGLRNIGLALLNEEGQFVKSAHFDLVDLPIKESVDKIEGFIDSADISEAFIERFVPYKGVLSPSAEQILMIIGGIEYMLASKGAVVNKARAIDWKPILCKWAVRNLGFKNPSTSFDKKFDLAMAKALTGVEFKTDHEGDAACLASLFRVRGSK